MTTDKKRKAKLGDLQRYSMSMRLPLRCLITKSRRQLSNQRSPSFHLFLRLSLSLPPLYRSLSLFLSLNSSFFCAACWIVIHRTVFPSFAMNKATQYFFLDVKLLKYRTWNNRFRSRTEQPFTLDCIFRWTFLHPYILDPVPRKRKFHWLATFISFSFLGSSSQLLRPGYRNTSGKCTAAQVNGVELELSTSSEYDLMKKKPNGKTIIKVPEYYVVFYGRRTSVRLGCCNTLWFRR